MVKLLKPCCAVKYELNPGGHFADPGKRLAKAVRFLAEEGINQIDNLR